MTLQDGEEGTDDHDRLVRRFRRQADTAVQRSSPLYEHLLRGCVADLGQRGPTAAAAFVELVGAVPGPWDGPGLGVWNLRHLVGHTSRSLITIETYLGAPDPPAATLADPVAYYRATATFLSHADADAVAERGRQAGRALGDDPAAAVRELADRVLPLVEQSPDDSVLVTPFGSIALRSYLPTRTFELTVHSLDIIRAAGLRPPGQLQAPLSASLALAASLAAASDRAADTLLALTGRQPLPAGFSVV